MDKVLSLTVKFAALDKLTGSMKAIQAGSGKASASLAETRKELGIHDNLIRVSVGIEDLKDLLADLDQALGR